MNWDTKEEILLIDLYDFNEKLRRYVINEREYDHSMSLINNVYDSISEIRKLSKGLDG